MNFKIYALFLLITTFKCITSEPIPDTSEQCLSCQNQISEMEDIWTNSKSVEAILKGLKIKCRDYDFGKQLICNKLSEVFVQIPPAIFQGMDDLAWPVPLAPCALIKQCKVECCVYNDPPEQVHLSLGSSKDSNIMGVSWVSLNQSTSVVLYGTDPNNLIYEAVGSISTYTSAGWVGTIHRATMTDLQEKVTYYYKVGDGNKLWSDVFSFTPTPQENPITYVVIADMDFDKYSDNTVKSMKNIVDNDLAQVVIHSGDISYADGYEPHWDDFMNKIQPIAANIPYMVSPGNHEFWFNFSSYKSRFFMPGMVDQGGSGDNMFFSWELGYTHFVSMNSETAIDVGNFDEAEIKWLINDLASVDRRSTPWIVVHFHRPMYCSCDSECGKEASRLKSEAENIFKDYKVDLVLTGHIHAYERTYPVYNNTIVSKSYDHPAAPVYIVQGASGNREGNKGSFPPPEELPEWSAAQAVDVGYGLMEISSNRISWKFFSSDSNLLVDEMTITK